MHFHFHFYDDRWANLFSKLGFGSSFLKSQNKKQGPDDDNDDRSRTSLNVQVNNDLTSMNTLRGLAAFEPGKSGSIGATPETGSKQSQNGFAKQPDLTDDKQNTTWFNRWS